MDDDLKYWLDIGLLYAVEYGVEKHAVKLRKLAELAERIRDIRGGMEVRQLGNPSKEHYAYAVDSSYGDPPLELIGGVFTVVAYGYVGRTKSGIDKQLSGELYFEDRDEADVSRFSAALERRLAAVLLKLKAEGEKDFDILLLDGEIAPHLLLPNLAGYEEVNKAVDSLLAAAEKAGVVLAAVAKRVRSSLLSTLGERLPINDRAAASMALKPGEYAVLGKWADVLPKWAEIQCEREGAEGCERTKELRAILENSEYPHLRLLGDAQIAYYMPPGGQTAVKVEVLDLAGEGIDEALAFLSSITSTTTGLPVLLDAVDRYVRVASKFVESALMMLIERAPSEVASVLLSPNNLQKFRRPF